MLAVEVLREEQAQESREAHPKRKLSTIKFPYGDLNDAAADKASLAIELRDSSK